MPSLLQSGSTNRLVWLNVDFTFRRVALVFDSFAATAKDAKTSQPAKNILHDFSSSRYIAINWLDTIVSSSWQNGNTKDRPVLSGRRPLGSRIRERRTKR